MPLLDEPLAERRRVAVDEQQVQAVADTEAVEARVHEGGCAFRRGGAVHVEHAPALGVRERADAVLGRETREARGRLAAATEDHERDLARQRDEDARSLAVGGANEPDRGTRQPGCLEGGPEHVVHEDRDRSERGAAGAEHGGVEALEELSGDVERDVRARLEVRPDGADRDPALRHPQAVLERPRVGLSREGLDLGHRLDLARELLEAGIVEPEAIERPRVEPALRRIAVRAVRGEDRRAALAHEDSRPPKRVGHEVVPEGGRGVPRRRRFVRDRLSERAHRT